MIKKRIPGTILVILLGIAAGMIVFFVNHGYSPEEEEEEREETIELEEIVIEGSLEEDTDENGIGDAGDTFLHAL